MPYNPETGEWISDAELHNLEFQQQYNPTQGTWSTVATGVDHGFVTDFDPDLSAQEIANMSSQDLDQLLKMYNLNPDKYSKYFAKFDQSELENIKKTFTTKVASLNTQSQEALSKLGQQERTITAQRGFEGGGDLAQVFKSQKADVFSKRAMDQEEAFIGKEEDIRSAYEDYESKFQSALGGVEAQIDANKGGDSCFAKGTLVLMSNGESVSIEDIKVGDKIVGYTGDINTVTDIQKNPLGNRDLYGFGNKKWFTAEHPFLTAEGWKSIAPDKTLEENTSFTDIKEMQVGDKLFIGSKIEDNIAYIHTPVKVITFEERANLEANTIVYNLLVDGNHSYHANGFVVHSIQPNFDATYVSNCIKNLTNKQKNVLLDLIRK